MKMLIAAFVIFPASWTAIPRTPPPRLVFLPPAERFHSTCSWPSSGGAEAPKWNTARQVSGVRDVTDLDRLGDGPIVVIDARLRGQRLAGHRVSKVCFEGGDLAGTDWRGVRAEYTAFGNSDLSGSVMTGTRLRRAAFGHSRLDRIDATGADLSESRIAGGSFDGLVLRDAKMRGASVVCGLLSGQEECEWPEKLGVDARGADLTRATLDVYLTDDWRFDGAVLDRTTVQLRQLASLRPASVRGPVFLEPSGGGTGGMTRRPVRLGPSDSQQLLAAFWMQRPSFDCAQATTAVERSICDPDERLAPADRRLAELFGAQLAEGKTTRAEQRRWLRTRDACSAKLEARDRADCISGAYEDRISALMAQGAVAGWIRPGARRLFLSSDVAPPAAFQRTALYRRIFPVLLRTAHSRITVRVRDRHRIEAGGEATRSNGHLCDLTSRSYSFEAGSGWFGAPRSADYRAFYPDAAAFERLLRFAGNDAAVGPPGGRGNDGEYIMCGARAGFDTVTAVRAPPEHRAAMIEVLGGDI